jgi:hypothetical protein
MMITHTVDSSKPCCMRPQHCQTYGLVQSCERYPFTVNRSGNICCLFVPRREVHLTMEYSNRPMECHSRTYLPHAAWFLRQMASPWYPSIHPWNTQNPMSARPCQSSISFSLLLCSAWLAAAMFTRQHKYMYMYAVFEARSCRR